MPDKTMGSRSEYDAAYFTLLRAREEHAQLLSYREYLVSELPRRMRRPVDQTTKAVVEAVGTRRSVVFAELERMDDRISNAQQFVEECETEVEQLRN
jgi:Zn-dependent oligopeptidase